MTLLRASSFVVVVLLVAGCGEQAKSVSPKTSRGIDRAAVAAAEPAEVTRDTTVDMDGWTAGSWEALGGRPQGWPRDLVPPLDTERATLFVQQNHGVTSTILSGRVPKPTSDLQAELEDQFEGWKSVDGVGLPEVIGTWERANFHVQVTVRKDNGTDVGSTYGLILRPRHTS